MDGYMSCHVPNLSTCGVLRVLIFFLMDCKRVSSPSFSPTALLPLLGEVGTDAVEEDTFWIWIFARLAVPLSAAALLPVILNC
jgi:hypothetical protein